MAAHNNRTAVPGDPTGFCGHYNMATHTQKQSTHNHIIYIPRLARWHGVSYKPFLSLAVMCERAVFGINIGDQKLLRQDLM